MQKTFCDKCGIELTGPNGYEIFYIKPGTSPGFTTELCAEHAFELKTLLSGFLDTRISWNIVFGVRQ